MSRIQPSLPLSVTNCPDAETALLNVVPISTTDRAKFGGADPLFLEMGGFVYSAMVHPQMEQGKVGLSKIQRGVMRLATADSVTCSVFEVQPNQAVGTINLEIDYLKKGGTRMDDEFDGKRIIEHILDRFVPQVWTKGQHVLIEMFGTNLLLTVGEILLSDLGQGEDLSSTRGVLNKAANIVLSKPGTSSLKLVNVPKPTTSLMGPSFNFESMGIGGLDKEFAQIFRRAFASRIYPQEFVKKVGISHVKGMLLYGPPGTGKTLIARQIGKMLNCREPKIVMGPEILNKFVGQSEENIRKLFADAEAEYAERGDESELHIIIMDELDAICKQRGSGKDSTGVHDTVVNQLLSKIDGVNSINNILLIGMTNRKDMIDDALLRPGRLEVHVEIGLPDAPGRLQILKIHTAKSSANGVLGKDVNLEELAQLTKNFSGAEIEGLVKSAVAFSFNRHVDASNLSAQIDLDSVQIMMDDFRMALTEIKPAFGASTDLIDDCLPGGMIDYGPSFAHLRDTASMFVKQIANSERTSVMTLLLEGSAATGKTALAAKLAIDSGFPFVKMISPDQYIGFNELSKIQAIHKVFDNAYKSTLSVIIIDDIELLLEFVQIGPRFSLGVLMCLKVLLKKPPPKGRKLVVIGTTKSKAILESLELSDDFTATLSVPTLTDPSAVAKVMFDTGIPQSVADECSRLVDPVYGIGIKRLLMVCEMAKTETDGVTVESFGSCLTLV